MLSVVDMYMTAGEKPGVDRLTGLAPAGQSLYALMNLDADGVVVTANTGCEELLGHTAGQMIGASVFELMIRPEDEALFTAELGRDPADPDAVLIGQTRGFTLLRADGSEVLVELTCIKDVRPPVGVTCLMRDAGEVSVLARNAAVMSTAERLGSVGTFEWNTLSGESRFSPEMYEIHGLDPSAPPPPFEEYLQLVHPDDRPQLLEDMVSSRVEGRTTAASEWRIVRPDGSMRRVLGSSAPMVWEDGQIARVVGTVRDITDAWIADVELALHAAVSEALAAWDTADGGVVGLLRRVCESTGWRMGALFLVDRQSQALRAHATWLDPGSSGSDFEQETVKARFRSGEGLPGRVWATGEPMTVWEVLTADPTAVVRRWSEELGGAMAFSVSSPGRFDGVLEFATGDAGPLQPGMRRTLRAVGLQLGDFLSRHRADLGQSPVSAREREVLQLAAHGGTTASIAAQLVVSPSTVKTHFEKIYSKLGVSDRAEAVAEAFRRGLVT